MPFVVFERFNEAPVFLTNDVPDLHSKALDAFWKSQSGTNWFKNHPVLSDPDSWRVFISLFAGRTWIQWLFLEKKNCNMIPALLEAIDLQKCFPIIYHGDDADSHRRRSFCAVTIGSPLVVGKSSWESKVLIYIIDVSKAVPETFDTLDSWVVHALTELQEGAFFSVDVYGQHWSRGKHGPICGGYRGVLVAIKGDQKYLARALKIKANWKSELVCPYCSASASGDLSWTKFGPHAAHRNTLVSTTQFILEGCKPNPWIRLPGFDISCLLQDWLHIVDLSFTPEVAASEIWIWIINVFPGGF